MSRDRALVIVSVTFPNGTGLVEVGIQGPKVDVEWYARRVAALLAGVAHLAGCPPLERHENGHWRLWCRSEHADRLRGLVCEALREVNLKAGAPTWAHP